MLIESMVRSCLFETLKSLVAAESELVEEIVDPTQAKVYGARIAFIMLWGGPVRLIFKVHYTKDSAMQLLKLSQGNSDDSEENALDLMQEICNLVGGRLRNSFLNNGVNVGLSLPCSCSGFDEIWFRNSSGNASRHHAWKMGNASSQFYFSTDLQIISPVELEQVAESYFDRLQSEAEVAGIEEL